MPKTFQKGFRPFQTGVLIPHFLRLASSRLAGLRALWKIRHSPLEQKGHIEQNTQNQNDHSC